MRRARAWLRFVLALSLAVAALVVWAGVLTARLNTRYQQLPPGQTLRADAVDVRLLALRTTTTDDNGRPIPGLRITVLAEVEITRTDPAAAAFDCSLALITTDSRMYVGTTKKDVCPGSPVGQPARTNVSFSIGPTDLTRLAGITTLASKTTVGKQYLATPAS